jgi:hypothetical protein
MKELFSKSIMTELEISNLIIDVVDEQQYSE